MELVLLGFLPSTLKQYMVLQKYMIRVLKSLQNIIEKGYGYNPRELDGIRKLDYVNQLRNKTK